MTIHLTNSKHNFAFPPLPVFFTGKIFHKQPMQFALSQPDV
jgi:hypothetical protein